MEAGIHHIDKPIFLELYQKARLAALSSRNIRSGFAATGLVPLNPDRVLSKLQIHIRTPSPPPPPPPPPPPILLPSPSLPLAFRTPLNVLELENLRNHARISPSDQALAKVIKGCQMAVHGNVFLAEENSQLRAENQRKKRKRAQKRAFIQTGGTLTIGEGIEVVEIECTHGRRLGGRVRNLLGWVKCR